ncbi:hypothetical protein HWV23_08890 [Natronomonas halophila]|uniref:OapC/ArvC family zinc-ribbon domain-containing protein n=1 Tax=Natronomonas halophila TaxID=2747817 RepID=UPI0015B4395D|nr:Zn-ribbon containing protein [Natronomonas halophila]QLD85834.1 hypothetical protein HWV23_08890 [Natronomonas halophila]
MPHQCTGCGHTFADGSKEMLSGCPECGGNKFQFRPSEEDLPDEPAESAESDAPSRPDADSSSVAETVGRATTKMRDLVSSGPESPSDDRGEPTAESTTESSTESTAESTSVPDPDSTTDPDATVSSAEPTTSNASAGSVGASETAQTDADPNPDAAWPSESEEAPADVTSVDSSSARPETGGEPAGTDDDDGEIIDADARRSTTDESDEDLAQASARSDIVQEDELPETDEVAATSTSGLESAESQAGGPEPDVDGRVVSEPDDEQPDIAELREQLNDQFESIKIVEPGQYELNLMELYDREEYIIALQENGRYVIQVPEQWMGEDPGER